MRVVSLLPAATDMVASLGALEHLVGVTHECDWPPVVASRARVTASRVGAHSAAEIDAQVRAIHETGEPLYTLRERVVRDLRPDVIFTQALCDVCAIHEGDVRALAESITPQPRVVTLAAETLDGVFEDIRRVGDALDLTPETDELLSGFVMQLRAIHETLKTARAPRPRVAVVEWSDPVFTGGHWIPDMIRRAGGIDAIASSGDRSRTISLDELRAANPDIIVFAPCGYSLERARAEASEVLQRDAWRWAQRCDAWAIDANAYMSRPGPRLVEGVGILARIFNPPLFSPLDPSHAERLQSSEMIHAHTH